MSAGLTDLSRGDVRQEFSNVIEPKVATVAYGGTVERFSRFARLATPQALPVVFRSRHQAHPPAGVNPRKLSIARSRRTHVA